MRRRCRGRRFRSAPQGHADLDTAGDRDDLGGCLGTALDAMPAIHAWFAGHPPVVVSPVRAPERLIEPCKGDHLLRRRQERERRPDGLWRAGRRRWRRRRRGRRGARLRRWGRRWWGGIVVGVGMVRVSVTGRTMRVTVAAVTASVAARVAARVAWQSSRRKAIRRRIVRAYFHQL